MPNLPEGISGISMGSGIAKGFLVAGQIVVVCVIVVVAVYLFLRFWKYNTKVIIFSERGKKGKVLEDKGGYFKHKDGSWSFKLLKERLAIEPPTYDYLLPSTKGNVLFLYQKDVDKFYPIKTSVVAGNPHYEFAFKSQDYDIDLWAATAMHHARQQFEKKSFIEKYAVYITLAVIVISVGIMFYLIVGGMSDVAGRLANTAAELASACKPAASASSSW